MKNTLIYIFFLIITLSSCRETFDAETNAFESILVVEATITNELKKQKILLSKTYLLEESEPAVVNNATVWIEDDTNNNYTFSQDADGNYISDIAFQAVPENTYTLYITTQDGESYQSSTTILTPISQIDDLYAELIIEDDEIAVMVDSYNENDATYFRYEYEETYKVVVPYYSPFDALLSQIELDNYGTATSYQINLIPRSQEEKTCYSTFNSIGIIQSNTNNLTDNDVIRFPVKLISRNSSVLRDRYSILVKQYVQNLEAYTYYKTINQLGGLQSLLSQNQPGYVTGNMHSINDNKERVIGYFEVTSVDMKRKYFNYESFEIEQPPWFYSCSIITRDYAITGGPDNLNERDLLYIAINILDYHLITVHNPYTIVNKECSDCTSFSSNIRPDFWED